MNGNVLYGTIVGVICVCICAQCASTKPAYYEKFYGTWTQVSKGGKDGKIETVTYEVDPEVIRVWVSPPLLLSKVKGNVERLGPYHYSIEKNGDLFLVHVLQAEDEHGEREALGVFEIRFHNNSTVTMRVASRKGKRAGPNETTFLIRRSETTE